MATLAPPRFASLGPAVAQFFAGCFSHTKGPLAGQPFILEDWQREDLDLIYELDDHGHRVWREVLYGVPRGNGKSPMAAGVGLFELSDRQDSPDVFVAAGSRGQAGILHEFASAFVEGGPLRDFMRVQRTAILSPRNRGTMRTISADGDLQHGLSVSAGLPDEFHVWKTGKQVELYWALKTATQKREDSLLMPITTAGQSRFTLCGELYDRMLLAPDVERFDVLESGDGCRLVAKDRDAGVLMIWRGAPDSADVSDPKIWRACNPASWITDAELERQAKTSPESVFRRLFLNQWKALDDAAVSPDQWDACAVASLEVPAGAPVWISVAMSDRADSGAVCVVTADGHPRSALFTLVGPSDAGTTVGPLVAETVRGLCSRYRCQGVVFNPIHFGPEALELGREGIPLWRREGATDAGFKEVDELMVPASRTLLTALADGGVRHAGDHDVRNQVLLLEAVVRRNAWRVTRPGPDRDGEGRRAEAGVALVMALHAAEGSAPAQPWAAAW